MRVISKPSFMSCVIQVGNCAFASDDGVVRNMTREIEEIYTAVFGRLHVLGAYILCSHVFDIPARGDGKKRLRAKATFKTHHFNTFRSGLLLGLAIFALIDGLLKGQYFKLHDVTGTARVASCLIYSTPARDATSDTVLGYLAFPIWLDLRSSVILFPFGIKPCSMGQVPRQLHLHIW